jgi:hypothetical protein
MKGISMRYYHYTDVELVRGFLARHGSSFRFDPKARPKWKGWHHLREAQWVQDYPQFAQAVSDHCSGIGDAYLAQLGEKARRTNMSLKNGKTHIRIERMLEKWLWRE